MLGLEGEKTNKILIDDKMRKYFFLSMLKIFKSQKIIYEKQFHAK